MSLKRPSDVANAEVMDVVNDISKKLDEFVHAVAILDDLDEKPLRIRDEVTKAELEKHARMQEFDKKLKEHKLITVQNVLQQQGKVAIDIDEYKELQGLHVRDAAAIRAEKKRKFDEMVAEKVSVEMELKKLQYAKKFAEATAREAAFQTEKNMLYMTIESLKNEIESQKKLTSELALAESKSS
eukprot:TRINITY_DN29226_c0_g1_i1.p1 TRINITY_DN29226_c0_g1~~TRINITY_DN29226_c0_g1_i1.p1  ORF type:complete len:199 (+),score=91.64 TRINITY_DN29226_c0_g1_i1:48-599(+)